MNEFISIKSLDKILYQRQPQKQNSCTPTSFLTPNTSPNSRLRILSPTNKLDQTDKFNQTQNPSQQFKTMIKRDALKKKMNLLTAKLQTNNTQIIKEENAFSDRLIITSFEKFVNETDQKSQKLLNCISKSPKSISNSQHKIPVSEEQIENFEKKIIKTKQILQEKREQLKYAKQQYQSNKQLLQQLKFELDQLNEDQQILEISTTNKSLKDEIVQHRQNLIKHKQMLLKVDQFISKYLKEQMLTQDCQFGHYINKFNNIFMQMLITLDQQI
ncbi:unnamed protein product [Paramecium primaurelia]|uniref:Uncharacterized protein n=1 Tax=Paramecium primaurelia TaxID=5886 RepID=A0A8S1K5C0_PARPR|nr:unnamed protein product [Paramecium primaurelia]